MTESRRQHIEKQRNHPAATTLVISANFCDPYGFNQGDSNHDRITAAAH